MPLLKSNPKLLTTKKPVAKQWKAVPSKPSATTAKAKAKSAKNPKPVKPELLKVPVEKRANKIVELLRTHYPDAECSLTHENPFQLLIATMLSAQCTDARVNM